MEKLLLPAQRSELFHRYVDMGAEQSRIDLTLSYAPIKSSFLWRIFIEVGIHRETAQLTVL